MSERYTASVLALLMACALAAAPTAFAATKTAPKNAAPPADQVVDGIAAIVDKQVITRAQLAARMDHVAKQMQQQEIALPEKEILQRQVLQLMINNLLLEAEAKRVRISVAPAQLEQAVAEIARRNNVTPERLRADISAMGLSWDDYLSELREQIRDDMLRQRFVENNINVSDSDVDAFLRSHGAEASAAPAAGAAPGPAPVQASGPELLELAQILIEVPDFAPAAEVQKLRAQAEDVLRKLRSGADFAALAASASNGPQALQGGNMGVRPLADWPDLFARAVADLPSGGLSPILQSGRGFHILKVLRRGYPQQPAAASQPQAQPARAPQQAARPAQPSGPMLVTQTHARHILIKTTAIMPDDKAKNILQGLRARLAAGESFAELAKRYSEDASAPRGGDLGWINPGDATPTFEQAMNDLAVGQVSEPIHSPFGWHLILVQERQQKDMEGEFRRMQARRELLSRRIGPAYEDWIEQLRGQAYIENRLEKRARGQ